MTTPADMPAWIGELSQGLTLDEESQTINGCAEMENQSFPGMSPLIGYSMVIYKQIHIITALNGLRRGCVYARMHKHNSK